MASIGLNQVGRKLNRTQHQIQYQAKRYSQNFSHLEQKRDALGPLSPYFFEFYTYKLGVSAHLSMEIIEAFDPNAITEYDLLPLAITQTGNSVGLNGRVGAQDIWYQTVFLGDLSFQSDEVYVISLAITTLGTGTYSSKISWKGGGVNLTNEVDTSVIKVTIHKSDVISPGDSEIIYNVYLYGAATDLIPAGYINYESATITKNGEPYTPRFIPLT